MVKRFFFNLTIILLYTMQLRAENFPDESKLLHMYQELFPATFTAQVYQDFRKMRVALHPMFDTDCAVKISYANGQPTVQLYIIF